MYVARYARRINKSRSCHAVCRETRCLESAPRVLPSRLRARTRLRPCAFSTRVLVHDLVPRLGGHVFFGAQVLPRFAGILARGFSSVVFSRGFSPSRNFLHELSSIYKRLLLSMQRSLHGFPAVRDRKRALRFFFQPGFFFKSVEFELEIFISFSLIRGIHLFR